MTWKKIEDEKVRHIWSCTDVKCLDPQDAEVDPNYYEESGTPVCSGCDQDMSYLHTEIKVS